ncbi:MAG: crosslink repair DNA glycosylase YcaQ family protein [Candidatus Krumholzibacteria bacterium]|nr:crosslink repair DNA glycosylase YcaQ family protein [Candidatus Krumholzibacteria bacterium]MDP6668451.1 crosslink repair DNA glycosylase YcaQ family protein [Candidatus Krumholzibacteria bacterium]MDP6798069.1 crosslink repair DNA glycosylase YcaQ family protein [Candidatus Krumholzibacteria bacterium]MDP7021544.1 crosslink repair DNA glycosylase YcaQ family protein [Candidatus Krumholzibacteria bacterium]
MKKEVAFVDQESLRRLWFYRQGLTKPRSRKLTARSFVEHLERCGGLQLDSVNVLDRAHYLTLWSRFGAYDRARLDSLAWESGLAHEFWGHAACLLPMRQLPNTLRSNCAFNPTSEWWNERRPSAAVLRRVRERIRREGALESADFKSSDRTAAWWGWKEEKMALEWLWWKGAIAIRNRRHFRRLYDLSERVYPDSRPASRREWEDSWLFLGLSGNGIASERHLVDYMTSPRLKAAERRKVIDRALRAKDIVEVRVEGFEEAFYARPESLRQLGRLPEPRGTTLLCPFDSFLWQRDRAEDLLGFRYRIEIYVPAPKRHYGYYVLPILHHGNLVGRVDPKFDRKKGELILHSIHLEEGFRPSSEFRTAMADTIADLARFLGAGKVCAPRGWKKHLE